MTGRFPGHYRGDLLLGATMASVAKVPHQPPDFFYDKTAARDALRARVRCGRAAGTYAATGVALILWGRIVAPDSRPGHPPGCRPHRLVRGIGVRGVKPSRIPRPIFMAPLTSPDSRRLGICCR